nr:11622_t:CDS:2 [Entrophospora candida]
MFTLSILAENDYPLCKPATKATQATIARVKKFTPEDYKKSKEVLGGEEILKILKERDLKLLLEYSTRLVNRTLDILCQSDIHAFLDNMKAPLELVNFRTKYYEVLIKTTFEVPIEKLKFVV